MVAAAGSDSCGPGSVRAGQWIVAWSLANHDVGLIGTSRGRRAVAKRIVTCRPNRSGDSSDAGAGSTKRCFGVQSDNQKNACDRTRERTAINRPSSACHPANTHSSGCARWRNALTREQPGKTDLTTRPLSEMSNRQQFGYAETRSGVFAERRPMRVSTLTAPDSGRFVSGHERSQ